MVAVINPNSHINDRLFENTLAQDASIIKQGIDNNSNPETIIHQFGELYQRINGEYSILEARDAERLNNKYIKPLVDDMQSLVDEAKEKCKFIISEFMRGNKLNVLSTEYENYSIVASFSVKNGEVNEATRRAMETTFETIANILK